ncbi:MAG TPA: AAC(3) family N-acetyltransferase [Spirochaetota bacterium]|nr:AAC(3) family N-acetyltransferase [Spirochaetota bacterium]
MITSDIIRKGIESLGICPGMKIEVHSSLRSFGSVEGGAHAVIRALMESVTENGSIVMPSFLMSPKLPPDDDDRALGITCKIRILSPDDDNDMRVRSGMGIIADTFKRMPCVVTGEGMFRLSAWGIEKEINCINLCNLNDNGGCALMLGTDIYSLSSMHYMESALPDRIKAIFAPNRKASERYPADKWFVETGGPPVKAWYKIQEEAFSRGFIKEMVIGKSRCMFFRISDVTGLYKHALETDPFGLYGIRD